jgi:hypothetical protein
MATLIDEPVGPHAYGGVVAALRKVFDELEICGLGDILSKGGVGSILLAQQLGHKLVPGDKGADAVDNEDKAYEYKVSITNQFNFNFGGRKVTHDPETVVKRHFAKIAGAYCALREREKFVRIVYCPAEPLIADLVEYFKRSKAAIFLKQFGVESFAALPGAVRVL